MLLFSQVWYLSINVVDIPKLFNLFQFALLHSVTCVQLRLITILGSCGCVAVAHLWCALPVKTGYIRYC
jgi:hypothetical protein